MVIEAIGARRIAAALLATAAVGVSGLLGGCTRTMDHKGYVVDSELIGTVAPGVDNKDSVIKTLGRPSFASEFDGGGTFYYFARETRSFGYGLAKPVGQMILTIRFTPAGDVSSVQKTGLETIRHVNLYGPTTPTLGRSRGFFTELFGNIGAGGPGQRAPTADKPN